MPQKILIINGPNLGNLGKREPEIYGNVGMDIVFARTEFLEGKIIGIVLNAGAFTHTSLALADCLSWIKVPYVEVHISNILARSAGAKSAADTLRSQSLIASQSIGIIAGFGLDSYVLAVEALIRYKTKN